MLKQTVLNVAIFLSVQSWANERNLPKGCKAIDQALKLNSENGELSDNIVKGAPVRPLREDQKNLRDDFGDNLVVMIVNSLQTGINFEKVFNFAIDHNNKALETFNFEVGKTEKQKAYAIYNFDLSKYILNVAMESSFIDLDLSLYKALVSLSYLASLYEIDLNECLEYSYNEIKDRKGVMYQGAFIKESDPAYQDAISAIESNS